MSDNIDIPIQASGEDGVNRLVSALDRLNASMSQLGQHSALSQLTEQMKVMQATMVTGFANLAALAGQSEKERERIQAEGADKRLRAQQAWELKQHASANKFHDKQVEIEAAAENRRASALQALIEKRDVQTHAAQQREVQSYVRFWDRVITEQGRAAATQMAIQQRRDTEMNALRQKELTGYVSWWEKTLAAEDAAHARQLEKARMQQYALAGIEGQRMAAATAAAEKQRMLNTSFITSPLKSQIATAERAQVYGSMGGNAAQQFGSMAAGADLAALRRQHELLPAAIRNSQGAIQGHNDIMREGHSLARGLTGSLGGLWLTYGSLVPLAAGAAIASSLKNIVIAGKEVEYQLQFVAALGGGSVNLDSFLNVTDATVVSVKEAAEGMRALAQNGLNAVQALQALPSVLNLAVIGEMSVSQAALSATGALSAFGLKLQDIDRVGDIFARAAATSNTSVSAMTESMRQASTVASVYGSTIEETAAALGVLAKINVTGSAAGTAYTNMLTNLYSPTRQAAAALKELGVTTDDGMGGLKNSTQLLTELRKAMSGFNEPAKADFYGDIFTVRGQKGAATIIDNLDLYKQKIEEAANASGFMGAAVAKLEDTTTGAFKRLQNSVSDSLNRAFASSSPMLQQLLTDLGHVARSDGAVKVLTAMADATLRLTTTFVDHAGAIALVVGGYGALKIVGGLTAMITTFAAAAATATTASIGLAGGIRLVTSALGIVGLAITAATVLWQIFAETTSDVEKADARLRNSIGVNIEYLERETKALQERNKAWNPATQMFDKKVEPDTSAESQTLAAQITARQAEIDSLDARLKKSKETGQTIYGGYLQADNLKKAQERDKGLLWKETAAAESLAIGKAEEAHRKERAGILGQISLLVEKGQTYKTVAGEMVAVDAVGNAKSRAIALSATGIAEQLKNNTIDAKQAKIELLAVEQKYNAALSARADKPDTKGENAALNAALKRLDVELQLQRLQTQSDIATARQQNKRGEIGDLQLINKELEAKLALEQAAVSVARRQYELAEGKDKIAKMATYQGRGKVAEKQAEVDTSEADEKRLSVLARMAQEEISFDAKTLAQKGQHQAAFLLEYEAQYGGTIKRVNADIRASVDQAQVDALESFLAYLERMKEAGKQNAWIKELQAAFSLSLSRVQDQMDSLADASGSGAGLAAVFNNALIAQQALAAAMPDLLAKQQALQAAANKTGDPADQSKANSALKEIENASKRMRSTWVSVGEAIGQALEKAFGAGGKALGGLINATIAYGVKRVQIEENYEKAKKAAGSDPVKQAKAQRDAQLSSASAQISAYGNMTAAAQGFFKEGSRGYEALGAAEKVFRLAEMAMTAQSMFQKLFATETVTTAVVTGHTMQSGAAVTGAGAITGANTLIGISAAKAGVATQAIGEPYTAWARMAAMAAVMVGLGFAVSAGGGKNTTAKDRQAATGTGSVFGDIPDGDGKYSVKSESIARGIELSAANSSIELNYTQGMLRALLGIQSSLQGLGNLIIRGSGVTGGVPATTYGAMENSARWIAGFDSVLGGFVGKATGAIQNAVFGGKTKALDTGLMANSVTVAQAKAGGLKASQYTDIKKDGGLFSSDKQWTDSKALSAEVNAQFSKIISDMADAVGEAGDLLGVGGDAFTQRLNNFVVDIGKISVKDLSGAEIQEQLETAFSKVGDDMARWAVGGLESFAKVGEGHLETLVRVAANYANLDAILKSVGMTFGATGMASLRAREDLIDMAGGIDELAGKVSSFSDNFLTEAEKLAPVQAYVSEQMAAMGLASIDTREEFKQHVLGLNLTVAAEQEQYVALMNLQEAFAKVHAATEDLSKSSQAIADERRELQNELDEMTMTSTQLLNKQRNAMDAANRVLFDQVQAAKGVATAREELNTAYEEEKQHLEENVDRIESLGQSWKKFRDGMLLGTSSPLTPQQRYLEARSQYETTLAAARGGDTKAQDEYEAVANSFLEASRLVNASGAAYTNDFARVMTATDDAVVWAAQQVDVGKASLDRLTDSVSYLLDIKAGVLTVAEALDNLAAATLLAGGATDPLRDPAAATNARYQELLAQRPNASTGLGNLADAMKGGNVLSMVGAAMRTAAEYRQRSELYRQAQDEVARSTNVSGMTKEQVDRLIAELAARRVDAERQAQEQADHAYNSTGLAADKMAAAAKAAADAARFNEQTKATTV